MQIVYDTPELHMERILKNFAKYKEQIGKAKERKTLDRICEELIKLRNDEELTQKQYDFLVAKIGKKYYSLAKKEGL